MAVLTLDGVACSTPDGTPLFSGLTLSVDDEVIGIVGRNGSGKTTLLRAIAGELPVAAGAIRCAGKAALLRQQPPNAHASVAETLGAAGELGRLDRIARGAGTVEDHDRADWSLPSRLEAACASVGLQPVDLERPAHSLSGGERTRLLLAGLLLRDPEIVLLDEPTNNLDEEGRQVILAFLQQWRGPTLVASHDRDLLASVGKIAELTRTGIRVVGGGWDEFERIRTAERVRVIEAADKAAAEVRTARRERQREAEKQARRDKRGRAVAAKDADPRIYLGAQKQRAEMTAARYRAVGGELLDRATDTFEEARAKVERDIPIRISLPASGLSSRHLLVNARGVSVERGGRQLFEPLDLSIVGPERVAITGRNGSGKTSLIRVILGLDAPAGGTIAADRERAALLDQEIGLLRPGETLIESIQRHNPGMARGAAHEALAAFGFRNDLAVRRTGTLSGGERVRLALACIFSRPEPPQMLVLDEPTNHLDLEAIEQLESALRDYDGAIICVTHDRAFLSAIGQWREISLRAPETF